MLRDHAATLPLESLPAEPAPTPGAGRVEIFPATRRVAHAGQGRGAEDICNRRAKACPVARLQNPAHYAVAGAPHLSFVVTFAAGFHPAQRRHAHGAERDISETKEFPRWGGLHPGNRRGTVTIAIYYLRLRARQQELPYALICRYHDAVTGQGGVFCNLRDSLTRRVSLARIGARPTLHDRSPRVRVHGSQMKAMPEARGRLFELRRTGMPKQV